MVESLRRHNPWGLPQNADEASADGVKVLVASQWVAGFDVESGSPSWVSYTLDSVRTAADQLQWRLDVRLEANHSSICDRIPDEVRTRKSLSSTRLWNGYRSNLFPLLLFPDSASVHVRYLCVDCYAPLGRGWFRLGFMQ